jgi:hypothetical protein
MKDHIYINSRVPSICLKEVDVSTIISTLRAYDA